MKLYRNLSAPQKFKCNLLLLRLFLGSIDMLWQISKMLSFSHMQIKQSFTSLTFWFHWSFLGIIHDILTSWSWVITISCNRLGNNFRIFWQLKVICSNMKNYVFRIVLANAWFNIVTHTFYSRSQRTVWHRPFLLSSFLVTFYLCICLTILSPKTKIYSSR